MDPLFDMNLATNARIKAIAEDGKEELVEHDTSQLLQDAAPVITKAIHAAITGEVDDDTDQPEGDDADQAADAPASAPSAAQVIEQCMAAKLELDVVVDLITFVEAQQALAVLQVQKPQSKLSTLAHEMGLLVEGKRKQLQEVASNVKAHTELLRSLRDQWGVFLGGVLQLQRRWKVVRLESAHLAAAQARSGHLLEQIPGIHVDITFGLAETHPWWALQEGCVEATPVGLIKGNDGHVCVLDTTQGATHHERLLLHPPPTPTAGVLVHGVQAVTQVLERRQRLLLRVLVLAHMQEEADGMKKDVGGYARALKVIAQVTSGVLSPKHGALLDTLALHMLHLKPHTTTHQPHTSMPTPSTGGYQPPRGGILGARGLLGTLQVALAHADAVLDLDTQLRGALGGGSIGGGSIGGGSTGATVRTTWHADQAPQAPQAPQRASHKDASQSNAVGVLNGCVTTGNPSMSALDVCALVRDGQQHTLPGVEGVLESGTRVHAHWVQTCAGNVACVRLRLSHATLDATTWGLLVLDGVMLHVEGFGSLLLTGVYGSLTRNVPLQHVRVQELLSKVDQGWRGMVE